MTASAKVIPMPNAETAKKEPHRMIARNTYCFPVDDTVLLDLLRSAAMLKERCGEPYSLEAAAVSLMLDRDKGRTLGKADYRRIWGWTEQQQRTRWQEIEQRIDNWTTAYGRLGANGPATDDQRTSNGKQADYVEESQNSNGRPTDCQRTANGHTTPTLQESSSSSSSDDEYDPFLLGNGWPDEEQVKTWAHTVGIPPDAAWEISQSLNNIAWVDNKGRKYQRWDLTIQAGWNARQKQPRQAHNGQHKQRTSQPTQPARKGHIPQDDINQRKAEREAIIAGTLGMAEQHDRTLGTSAGGGDTS